LISKMSQDSFYFQCYKASMEIYWSNRSQMFAYFRWGRSEDTSGVRRTYDLPAKSCMVYEGFWLAEFAPRHCVEGLFCHVWCLPKNTLRAYILEGAKASTLSSRPRVEVVSDQLFVLLHVWIKLTVGWPNTFPDIH